MQNKEDDAKVEDTFQDMIKGLEMTLDDLRPRLYDTVDGLTTKQLRRSLKAAINFIATREDDTNIEALLEGEKMFIGSLFSLIETSANYRVHILAKIQKEVAETAKGEQDGEERKQ